MNKKKIIVFLADGLGDKPNTTLSLKSPLEYANTPTIDDLAKNGILGLHDPIEPGYAVESDVGNLAILGYNPDLYYPGRGSFEALGVGINLEDGDIAFRANFATIKNGVIYDRRAGRITEDTSILSETLTNKIKLNDVKVIVYSGVEHRAVVVFRGLGLSNKISDTDPHKTGVSVSTSLPLNDNLKSKKTAKIINSFSKQATEILSNHEFNINRNNQDCLPVNTILLRSAGIKPVIPSFKEMHELKGAIICGVPLIRGIGVSLSMNLPKIKGATGTVKTNLNQKAKAAIDSLKVNDFVYVYVKGTDSASHDRNAKLKVDMIEKIDKMINKILNSIDLKNIVICITGDHCTPVSEGEHSGDPVPVLIWSEKINKDSTSCFNEKEAHKGGLNRIRAIDLIKIMKKYGNWDQSRNVL